MEDLVDAPSNEGIHCKNCETPFTGKFCPNCGQPDRIFEKPVKVFLYDFLGDLFAFDSRLWRSMLALLFRPGRMVSEYVGGKHIRYTPPFRVYVFFSFFFFLALSAITSRMLEENKSGLAKARAELIRADTLDQAGRDTTVQVSGGILALDVRGTDKTAGSGNGKAPDEAKNRAIVNRLKAILANPEPFLSSIYKYLSWTLFLLMPLFGSFLWLFFRKSRSFYVPHLLFAINLHTVAFFLSTLVMTAALLWPDRKQVPEANLLWFIPIYAYTGAYQLYQKGWLGTFWRLFGALILYSWTIVFAMVLLLMSAFKDILFT